jgi:hypothetical protein
MPSTKNAPAHLCRRVQSIEANPGTLDQSGDTAITAFANRRVGLELPFAKRVTDDGETPARRATSVMLRPIDPSTMRRRRAWRTCSWVAGIVTAIDATDPAKGGKRPGGRARSRRG